jgi:predicted nucleic acid-binding protein
MAASVLLDSVILIDHFNGVDAATTYLRSTQNRAVVSVVTRAEVLVGFSSRPARAEAEALFGHYECLPLTSDDADDAAHLRREYDWALPDAFQAALAQRHGLFLATRNTADFDPEQFSFVEVPYRLST